MVPGSDPASESTSADICDILRREIAAYPVGPVHCGIVTLPKQPPFGISKLPTSTWSMHKGAFLSAFVSEKRTIGACLDYELWAGPVEMLSYKGSRGTPLRFRLPLAD